jgi:two-component system, NtrC family, response regulator PilR
MVTEEPRTMRECTTLLISTDPSLAEAVAEGVRSVERLRLEVCGGMAEALTRLGQGEVPLGLIHLPAEGDAAEVTRFVAAVAARQPGCALVVLSDPRGAHPPDAFLRAGAAYHAQLPVEPGRLACLLETLTARARSGAGPAPSLRPADPPELGPFLAGLDPEVLGQLRRVAPQETTVLFSGETGTGKTSLARLTHALSPRRAEPFLVVDCAALSPGLLESELFGHVRGAFTGAERDRAGKFAAAGAGTLLLDEVNSLPAALQAKLLRAADERVFEPVGSNRQVPLRARLLAATNTPLDGEVRAGRFRADLYYRLNVVGLYLAPLRQRRGAVAALAGRFLAELAGRGGGAARRLAAEAVAALEGYHWPGNVRELRNVIERAVALCPGAEVQLDDLPPAVREAVRDAPAATRGCAAGGRTLGESREEVEVLRITEALVRHNNNRQRAAAELGISRMALYKKLHKYGLMGAR